MSTSDVKRSRSGSGERKRVPKTIAVVFADNCTGCEACIAVCPVDCITLIETGLRVKGTQAWCEVDMDRCIGCALCVRVPKKKADPYELKICPWDAIDMVPTEQLPRVVELIGGPPDYAAANKTRLAEAAQRNVAAHAAQ